MKNLNNAIELLKKHGYKHRTSNLFACPNGHQGKNYNLSVFKGNDGNFIVKCNWSA